MSDKKYYDMIVDYSREMLDWCLYRGMYPPVFLTEIYEPIVITRIGPDRYSDREERLIQLSYMAIKEEARGIQKRSFITGPVAMKNDKMNFMKDYIADWRVYRNNYFARCLSRSIAKWLYHVSAGLEWLDDPESGWEDSANGN